MPETRQQRVNRLKGRRAELRGSIRELRDNPVRNVEHKIAGLDAQVEAIDRTLKKFKRKGVKG
jgi:chromosome segregation ATPase